MSSGTPDVRIALTFVDADAQGAHQAVVERMAHEALGALAADGYAFTPQYSGTRGGVPFELVQQAAQAVHDNRELLTELVKLATPIVTALIAWHKARTDAKPAQTPPVSVVIAVQTVAVTVPPAHAGDDAWLLAQLLAADPGLPARLTGTERPEIRVEVQPPPRRRG